MSYRVVDLTSDTLELLPSQCRRCTFWELGSGQEAVRNARRATAKYEWTQQTEVTTGPPGKILLNGERAVGYALIAPGAQLKRSRLFVHQPSDDALLLATAWIDPCERGDGAGARLVRAVAVDAHKLHSKAVEAYGMRNAGTHATDSCVLSEAFLQRMGFQVWKDHPTWPLLRLDPRQTVVDTVEGALARVGRAFRPRRFPVPARPIQRVGGTPPP